jgi:SET domain-containing protein
MDNPKVYVKNTRKFDKGVFAKEKIREGEIIAEFDGRVYSWRSTKWNEDLYNHTIQFEKKKWRDSKGIARLINHSCNPNCGIKDLFKIVAMRDIPAGSEITWDYEMTERHPYWRMKCRCGHKDCRKIIGNYDNMPDKFRKKYKGYISEWLLKEQRRRIKS